MNLTALFKVSYGLYVVSSKMDSKLNGQIANTLNQVTAEPAQVAIALNKDNLTHEFVRHSNVFSASILAQSTPMKFIGHFGFKSGRDINKLATVEYRTGQSGAPIVLENTVAYIDAKVVSSLDVGSHTIFVGEVIDADTLLDHEPMTYTYYHRIKGGKSPKNAPTYRKEEDQPVTVQTEKYKCRICGYVYDPKVGDPDNNINPGTPFNQIPDIWVCPICNADKSEFEALG